MASTFTTNAHLELQGTGDNSGTWGAELNNNVFTLVDNVFGAVQTLALSGSDITVTTTQSQVNLIKLTGVLTANVSVFFPAIGRTYFVQNSTTGAFTVTLKIGAGATALSTQGASEFFVLDGTNVYLATPSSLPITGGTLVGNLTISKTSPAVVLNKGASGQENDLKGLTSGTLRWQVRLGDSTSESGSNAGSNFDVDAYSDAGTYLYSPISIARATGYLNANVQLYEAGQRVYSPNNPQTSGMIGVGQTWQSVSRTLNTVYQNTTGRPIMVASGGGANNTVNWSVSANGSTYVQVLSLANASGATTSGSFIVPNGHFYRFTSGNPGSSVAELR